METFYSTLATVTATVLAILAGALAAYAVFLRERSATFEDIVVQNQIQISGTLLQMRSQPGWGLSMYLPTDFKNVYRSKITQQAGPELINQAAVDLIYQRPLMQQALAEVTQQKQTPDRSADGRIFFWILKESVHTLSGGGPDMPIRTSGAFPNSADGPGFDEWREDYKKTRPALWMLFSVRQEMLNNLQQFEPQGLQHWMSANAVQVVNQFFAQVETIDKALDDIERQQILKQPYLVSRRLSWSWILLLSGLAFLLGVVAPLFLLAWSFPANRVGASVFIVAVLALTAGPIILFGRDLMTPPRSIEPREYLKARWYKPLLDALDTSVWTAEHADMLNQDIFLETKSSPDFPKFPSSVSENIEQFIAAASSYNKTAIAWNKAIVAAMQADSTLGRLSSLSVQGRGGSLMPPADIFTEERIRVVSELAAANPNGYLAFHAGGMPNLPDLMFQFPLDEFSKNPAKLAMAFRSVGASLANSPEKKNFETARTRLLSALSPLKTALASEK